GARLPDRGVRRRSLATPQTTATGWSRTLLDTASIADRISEIRPQTRQALREFAAMIEKLREFVPTSSPASLLERIVQATEFEKQFEEDKLEGPDRLANVKELIAGAAEWSEEVDPEDPSAPLERYLAGAALESPAEREKGDGAGVSMMTVHTAKGLEWPVIFLSGMEDGLFPLSRATDTAEGIEEERRL